MRGVTICRNIVPVSSR